MDIIKYLKIPFPRFPLVKDAADDWNPVRGDYQGGVFAGPFGSFYERWVNHSSAISTGGATTIVDTAAVPAGYLYVLQAAAVKHTDPTARKGTIMLRDSDLYVIITENVSLAQYAALAVNGTWVLQAGDRVKTQIDALATGKKVYLAVWGYKVRL